ncbi:Acyl-coenzyme A thioesterase THEM4 [Candidatus Magnetomoraceae bacterium gMMP-13]
MNDKAIQDYFSDDIAVCYGCGRNNPHGLHIRTKWDGKEGIFHFKPEAYHTAFPGILYGGLIASLIDCHSIGTAIAAAYQAENQEPGTEPEIMYVTANLNVNYIHPTPVDSEIILRSHILEMSGRKAIVACSLYAGDKECANGKVTAVRISVDKLKAK